MYLSPFQNQAHCTINDSIAESALKYCAEWGEIYNKPLLLMIMLSESGCRMVCKDPHITFSPMGNLRLFQCQS